MQKASGLQLLLPGPAPYGVGMRRGSFKVPPVPGGAERLPSMSFHLARWHPCRGAAHTLIINHPPSLQADSYPRADWPQLVGGSPEWALLPRPHFKPLSLRATTWPYFCQEKGPRLQRLMTAESEAAPCKMAAAGGGRLEPEKASIYNAPSSLLHPGGRGPGCWLPRQYGRPSGPAPTRPWGPSLPMPQALARSGARAPQ